MVLCNTGIGVPEGRGAPRIIRSPVRTAPRSGVPTNVDLRRGDRPVVGSSDLAQPTETAFRAPYRSAEHRRAIADFVGDVPLVEPHPSADALMEVADRLSSVDAPVLLAWGAKDIVFDDDFAADLAGRFPNTRLQRFPEANHLVMAEADVATTVDVWLRDVFEHPLRRGACGVIDTGWNDVGVRWPSTAFRRHRDGGRRPGEPPDDRLRDVHESSRSGRCWSPAAWSGGR